MIYTITLNPALDGTLWVQRVRDDVSNRVLEEKSFAGGKSIDVSRILKNLGMDNTALGFVDGFAGRELEGRLLNDGIRSDFVRISPNELMHLIEKLESLPSPGSSGHRWKPASRCECG